MSSKAQTNQLLAMFAPATYAEWQKMAEAELDGASIAKLISHTYEGIDLQPIYWPDQQSAIPATPPGSAPFLRGVRSNLPADGPWYICETITGGTAELQAALNRGATAIELTPNAAADLLQILAGVQPEAIALYINPPLDQLFSIAEALASLTGIHGALGIDPLLPKLIGKADQSAETINQLAKLLPWAAEQLPHMQTLMVDARIFYEQGASAVEELAFALAGAVAQLRTLQEQGIAIDLPAAKMRFQFAIGTQIFMEIAKLRAARVLWAKIAKAFGAAPENAKLAIHASSGLRSQTIADPHVNMLRATTIAFAATIGGCESLSITPFDQVFQTPNNFSRRIAINIQHLLYAESHLGEVLDPGGGSWYLEALTDQLARKAWELFQDVERQGGMHQAIEKGFVQERIAAIAKQRAQNLATRRDVLIGSTRYANPNEQLPAEVPLSAISPRDAEPFEVLRRRAEAHGISAFLANIGSRQQYQARTDFATDFLQVAGIKVINQGGFADPATAATAAIVSQAPILVICSNDPSYPEIVPAFMATLKANGSKQIIVLAGNPPGQIEQLRAAGIAHFIHLRSDLIATLAALMADLE